MSNFSDTNDYTIVKTIEASQEINYQYEQIQEKYLFNGLVVQSPKMVTDNFQDLYEGMLVTIELPTKYKYRPEALSNEVYGTTEFWYLILRVNGLFNHGEMDSDTIKIISPEYIDTIQDIVQLFQADVAQGKVTQLQDLTIKRVIV